MPGKTSPAHARAYFRRLAARERTKAAMARRDAAASQDAGERLRLEALAEGHEATAAIYDQRHDEVT